MGRVLLVAQLDLDLRGAARTALLRRLADEHARAVDRLVTAARAELGLPLLGRTQPLAAAV